MLIHATVIKYLTETLISLLLGDSRNYMLPILVLSPAKRTATQILVIANLNGKKDFESFCLWYHSFQQGITCMKNQKSALILDKAPFMSILRLNLPLKM